MFDEIFNEAFKAKKKPRDEAIKMAEYVKSILVDLGVSRDEVYYAGSLRRMRSEVGDIDVVVNSPLVNKNFYLQFLDKLEKRGLTVSVKSMGESQASIVVSDFLVELKRTSSESLGAMLLHASGSADFNKGMRAFSKSKGFSLNQYGLFKDGVYVAGKTEEDIFKALGVQFVDPPNRTFWLHKSTSTETQREEDTPEEIWDEVPQDVRDMLKHFTLPERDDKGNSIPRDFLWNKTSRHNYYRRYGTYKLPDMLKLDRYAI